MAVSGRDIRMKEFRRAVLRGYSSVDVDTFLMQVAVEIDRRDRYEHMMSRHGATAETEPEPEPEPATSTRPAEPQSGEDERETAVAHTNQLLARAEGAAEELHRKAREVARQIIEDARANAERGLRRTQQRAAEILQEAREHQERASRAEAEAHLKLAHVNQRLAEEAATLAEEARRLDDLAAWLAEQDLAPDQELAADGHRLPSIASEARADVVPFQRVLED